MSWDYSIWIQVYIPYKKVWLVVYNFEVRNPNSRCLENWEFPFYDAANAKDPPTMWYCRTLLPELNPVVFDPTSDINPLEQNNLETVCNHTVQDPMDVDDYFQFDSYFKLLDGAEVFEEELMDGHPINIPTHYADRRQYIESDTLECYVCSEMKKVVEMGTRLKYIPPEIISTSIIDTLSNNNASIAYGIDQEIATLVEHLSTMEGYTYEERIRTRRVLLNLIMGRLFMEKQIDVALDLIEDFLGPPNGNKVRFQICEG